MNRMKVAHAKCRHVKGKAHQRCVGVMLRKMGKLKLGLNGARKRRRKR